VLSELCNIVTHTTLSISHHRNNEIKQDNDLEEDHDQEQDIY